MKRLISSGLLLLAAIGCGSKDTGTVTADGKGAAAPSPATQTAVVTNGASTEPGEIVALFLDSLRRGDEKAANGVLTGLAQTSLAQTDYTIDPLGTPDGKYTIGRVGFVDGDSTTGLVECLWTEPNPEAGKPPVEMEIVCEVHKEPQGWRISGMAVKMAGSEETFVLDFEDPKSLQQALGGDSASQSPANVAQVPAGGASPAAGVAPVGQPVAGQMPAQPGFPPAQPGFPPAQPGFPPAQPGFPPAQPGFPPAQQPQQVQQFQSQQPAVGQPSQFPQIPSEGQPTTQIAFPPNPSVNR